MSDVSSHGVSCPTCGQMIHMGAGHTEECWQGQVERLGRVVGAAREFLRAEYEVRGLSVIMARRVHLIEALEALDANDTLHQPKEAE